MFTLEQIKAAHSKVKSGADFPAYIREIKALGVAGYRSYVQDGHIDYFGADGDNRMAPPKYDALTIADQVQIDTFLTGLAAHQQGQTDYPTFIQLCAETGVDRWEVNTIEMTCTYFDKEGKKLLTEEIPG